MRKSSMSCAARVSPAPGKRNRLAQRNAITRPGPGSRRRALSGCCCKCADIPGPLAKAHESLGGSAKLCQVSMKYPQDRLVQVSGFATRKLPTRYKTNKGLHATYPRSGLARIGWRQVPFGSQRCEFQMIHWTPTRAGFRSISQNRNTR